MSRRIILASGDQAGRAVSTSVYCGDEPELPVDRVEREELVIGIKVLREQKLPAAVIVSQTSGFSLKNAHAHLYARAEARAFRFSMAGHAVRLEATPVSFDWNYGDGEARRLTAAGVPLPEGSFDIATPTSHVYETTGDFAVNLTTNYAGRYSIDGAPWAPIAGSAPVRSSPVTMSVWRTKKLLVDSNCIENPRGPACDSPFLDEKP